MPRLSKAKKDVISCEKLGVRANIYKSQDLRMGQPGRRRFYHTTQVVSERGELKHLSTHRKRKQK